MNFKKIFKIYRTINLDRKKKFYTTKEYHDN